jgi:hypothetical protein
MRDVQMDRGHVLAAYATAWAQQSEQSIRQALEACWTETSTYVSPLTDVVHGVDGLTNLILDFPVMFPGASMGATTHPDVHHDAACVPWRMRSTAPIRTMGRNFGLSLDGVDFVEFDDEGHIRRITAFFGFTSPAVAPGAARLDEHDGPDSARHVLDLADDQPVTREHAAVHRGTRQRVPG